jgi:hypothetical protein
MAGSPVVDRCMLIWRVVTAANVTASQAPTKLHPVDPLVSTWLANGCGAAGRAGGIVEV